jgi:hypothetical protein
MLLDLQVSRGSLSVSSGAGLYHMLLSLQVSRGSFSVLSSAGLYHMLLVYK